MQLAAPALLRWCTQAGPVLSGPGRHSYNRGSLTNSHSAKESRVGVGVSESGCCFCSQAPLVRLAGLHACDPANQTGGGGRAVQHTFFAHTSRYRGGAVCNVLAAPPRQLGCEPRPVERRPTPFFCAVPSRVHDAIQAISKAFLVPSPSPPATAHGPMARSASPSPSQPDWKIHC